MPFDFLAPLSTADVILRLGFAVVFVAWMLTSVITFSMMVGCMTDSTGGAVFAGVGLWMTWLILDAIDSLGRIRDFFPTHYSGNWVQLFTQRHLQLRPGARRAAHARLLGGLHGHRRLVVPPQRHPQLTPLTVARRPNPVLASEARESTRSRRQNGR